MLFFKDTLKCKALEGSSFSVEFHLLSLAAEYCKYVKTWRNWIIYQNHAVRKLLCHVYSFSLYTVKSLDMTISGLGIAHMVESKVGSMGQLLELIYVMRWEKVIRWKSRQQTIHFQRSRAWLLGVKFKTNNFQESLTPPQDGMGTMSIRFCYSFKTIFSFAGCFLMDRS